MQPFVRDTAADGMVFVISGDGNLQDCSWGFTDLKCPSFSSLGGLLMSRYFFTVLVFRALICFGSFFR